MFEYLALLGFECLNVSMSEYFNIQILEIFYECLDSWIIE